MVSHQSLGSYKEPRLWALRALEPLELRATFLAQRTIEVVAVFRFIFWREIASTN